MKNHHPLTLIDLTTLLLTRQSSAAGSARVAGVAVRPELEMRPAWEFRGELQGVRLDNAVNEEVSRHYFTHLPVLIRR